MDISSVLIPMFQKTFGHAHYVELDQASRGARFAAAMWAGQANISRR